MSNGSMTPAALRMIRLALFTGVILFGGVAWYVVRDQTLTPMAADRATILTGAFIIVAGISLLGLMAIRRLQAAAEAIEKRGTLAVIGWALGEAPALLGGVMYLLTGSPLPYFAGVALLLVAFALVPVPEP